MNPNRNNKEKQQSGGGWKLEPILGARTLLDPRVANELIGCINATGKMSLQWTDEPEPSILYSEGNIIFSVPRPQQSDASSSSEHPWQITLQDTPDQRTVQVSAGYVFCSQLPGATTGTTNQKMDGSGTGVDITFPSTPGDYFMWVRCYDSGGGNFIAELKAEPTDTLPGVGLWPNFPAAQHFDFDWFTPHSEAYVAIGYVTVPASGQATITQFVVDNPAIQDFSSDDRTSWGGNWSSGVYRRNTLVVHGGTLYIRSSCTVSDSGGTPGSSIDWTALP